MQLWWKLQKMGKVPTTSNTTSPAVEMKEKEIEIEKSPDMHVNTVAGPFTVRL